MTLKEIAQDFLRLASRGNAKEAFQLYAGENFKHHNPFFKGDGQSLMTAIDESAKESPNKIFDIKRALEDGDLVAVHSHVQQEKLDMAVMHIFRFDNNKIAELWDFGQAIPVDMVNENGMF